VVTKQPLTWALTPPSIGQFLMGSVQPSVQLQIQHITSPARHHHTGSGPGPSMLRNANDDDDGDESVVRGQRTEPMFGDRSESLLGAGGQHL